MFADKLSMFLSMLNPWALAIAWNKSLRIAWGQKNLPILSPFSSFITMLAVVLDTNSHFLIFKLKLGHLIIAVSGASGILDLQIMQMYVFFTSTANIVPLMFFLAFSFGFRLTALLVILSGMSMFSHFSIVVLVEEPRYLLVWLSWPLLLMCALYDEELQRKNTISDDLRTYQYSRK